MGDNQEESPKEPPKPRAAIYIDGYNLYHSINDMGEPHLKWCNLWKLSQQICDPHDLEPVKVVFCTAMPLHKQDSLGRHRTFNNAQIASGVKVIEGHYIFSDDIRGHQEKQSDINVALSVILDGIDDVYDWAILVSADSDQAATARVFKERLSKKKLAIVAPPERRPPEKAIPYSDLHFTITKSQIEESLLVEYVPSRVMGGGFIRRPREYDPPEGWLAPSARPKRIRGKPKS